MSSDKTLTRIGGLLRQAESTDNEHEAATFLAAAQRLATQSSIDLAVARSHVANRERRPLPVQRMVTIGEPGKKGLRTYAHLFLVIAAANDVQCDITQSSALIYAHGFDTDIDTCEALYSSLLVQMVRASDSYIKSGAYRTEMTDRRVTEQRGRQRVQYVTSAPVAGVTARLNFQTAFANRIGKRLGEAKQEIEQGALARDTPATGTAIALRNKEIELRDFYRKTSQARGTWRGGRATAGYSSHARRAGDRAGQAARLGTAPEIDGPRRRLGK